MAIKLPDPGNGIPEQKTGNDEWTNMKIVRDNFADQSNAASRLVGTGKGQIPLSEDTFKTTFNRGGINGDNLRNTLEGAEITEIIDNMEAGDRISKMPPEGGLSGIPTVFTLSTHTATADYRGQLAIGYGGFSTLSYRSSRGRGDWGDWATFYSNKNTTKEEGTGYLVASSPVLKMQHDSFEKVHEAEQLDIVIKHIKTGVYEITGTTGLREGDGWNLKPPKDVNGNVLCICEASEKDGVITLKTYKKKFDFETVSIVADYEQPTDIPEGATVMLRFNDLPQEQLDEPAI